MNLTEKFFRFNLSELNCYYKFSLYIMYYDFRCDNEVFATHSNSNRVNILSLLKTI